MPTKNAIYQRYRALDLKARRLCKTCMNRLDRNGARCQTCIAKEKIRRNEQYHKKPKGTCPVNSCSNPSTEFSKTCNHHRTMNVMYCALNRKKKRKMRESNNG